jgi:starch synthase
MNVLSVTSEMFPLVKTGGLADVAGALPKAMSAHNIDMRTLLPGYPIVLERLAPPTKVTEIDIFGMECRLLSSDVNGLPLLVLDAPSLYSRPGGPYVDEHGRDFSDNWRRFSAISFAAASIAEGLPGGFWKPDLVHLHDWQTALTSVYLKYTFQSRIPTVLTIHNLAFQGKFGFEELENIALPEAAFGIDCLEYYGAASFLKGGIQTADVVTTVSPTYAREIVTHDLGMGMDGVLKSNKSKLKGIVNGIDVEVWDPSRDPCLISTFGPESPDRRAGNRNYLMNLFDFSGRSGPLFAVVSRLTWQKGIDLLIDAVPHLVDSGGHLIVCGEGDRALQDGLRVLTKHYPENVAVSIGYNEGLAHLIHGGADFVIQPSRFEPCGLTQLYALRYGAIPLVSRTGGLSETIIDANDAANAMETATGIQFHPVTTTELEHAIDRAFDIFGQPTLMRRLQTHAMRSDFSWKYSADRYANLFSGLVSVSPKVLPLSDPRAIRQPSLVVPSPTSSIAARVSK